MKHVVIERLGPEGHSALETDIDSAIILLADEIARGCVIYCRNNQQQFKDEEDLRLFENSAEEPVRVMVIPPIVGG
ncbi:MAG: hypothetical protein WED04_12395 [Promethearchaeati archaeon SRVP18_Atabeyarchaeia-1]